MVFILILLSMIFCHIVDDYYLQGWLASAKQKKWWEKNAPDKLYRNDYIMALFMHAFSWSFMIMLPMTAYTLFVGHELSGISIAYFFVNIVIHALTDNLKANSCAINLIHDQLIHLAQIFMTWALFVLSFM